MMNAECRMSRAGAFALAGVLLVLVAGCGTPATPRGATGAARADGPAPSSGHAAKGRAQIWAENCQRCHNARPASWHSEREWEVAMHHMLVRGSITRREHDAVMEFFRAAR